jgi:hypothetical protein
VAKGEDWFHAGAAADVELGAYPFVELSAVLAPDTVFKSKDVEVPVIAAMLEPEGPAGCVACNGPVGT